MKYDKNHHPESIIKSMAKGHSITAWAGSEGLSRDIAYKWIKKHKEFKRAAKVGYAKGCLYWEKELMFLIKTDSKVAGVIFILKTRFHKEYGQAVKTPKGQNPPGSMPGNVIPISESFEQMVERKRREMSA